MRHAILSIMMVVLIAGCGDNKPEPATTWCVLLDMSGVREKPQTREQYSQNFSKIMKEIKPGDALIVAMITESSINEANFVANHQFDAFQPTTDNEMYQEAEQAKFDSVFAAGKKRISQSVKDFIINNPRITQSTDIISAIHLAAGVFKKHGNKNQNLIILSDMEQYSTDYKFPKENLNEERINQIIDTERQKARGIPGLTGVKVYVAGAKSKNSDRFFRIKNFWLAYFDACHATLMKEDYGAAMIEF